MQKIPVANIDIFLFNAINGFAKKSRTLDFFGIFCAKYLGYVLIAMLLIFYAMTNNFSMLFFSLLAGAISVVGINEGIYYFYKRKRPLEIISATMLIGEPMSPAFPSSHTSFFFGLSFTLLLFNASLAIVFLSLSCLISLARVFCGVHWPSDILGGIFSAFVSFLIISSLLWI